MTAMIATHMIPQEFYYHLGWRARSAQPGAHPTRTSGGNADFQSYVPVSYTHLDVYKRQALCAAILATFLTACQAQDATDSVKTAVVTEIVVDDGPDLEFRGTISGDVLDFKDKLGDDTPAVKQFKKTGKNPYNGNEAVIKNGYTIYSTACSGCHGHLAEGKLGPALHDDYCCLLYTSRCV